jgi:radical SAM protein with 4Fe4S-binding SPASM domain
VVVWNITRRCNLHCAHCYSSSQDKAYAGELDFQEARRLLEDLSKFKVPALLLSGGEPTCRHDLPEIVSLATSLGVRIVLSTNGTLLSKDLVKRLSEAGLNRVGISLDGTERTNDKFRGSRGAYAAALAGIRNALGAGMRVSLRVTVTKWNAADLPALFDLCEREGVQRLCVYHLAYAGRGARLLPFDLRHTERRRVVEALFRRTLQSHGQGTGLEVLTVDNHADGPFLLLWSRENTPERSAEIERLLLRNGGNSAGKGIGCVDNLGNVHPDQFWWSQTLGNVRQRPFSEIWTDPSSELLTKLRDRKPYLDSRCQGCNWLAMCNGNLRVRAETATGNVWGLDPACYLSDAEVKGNGR